MNYNENENFSQENSKTKFFPQEIKKIEEPIYVMTVELEKGKSENIKIFSNSKPEELAYEFCKRNNLDFSSLSYLTNEIVNLVKDIPNIDSNNNNKFLENNLENEPIEEVDEEYYTQSVEKSNVKKKINNSVLNDILENENQKDIQIIDLNNNSKLADGKIDLSGTKGRIDLEENDSFGKFINNEEENGGKFNLDLELELEKSLKENNNNDNNDIFQKSKNAFSAIINKKRNMSTKGRMRRENEERNINDNFDFYQVRKKIFSYENFFNNFQKKLLSHSNSCIKGDFNKMKKENDKNINSKKFRENYEITSEKHLFNSWNNHKHYNLISNDSINSKKKYLLEKHNKVNKSLFNQSQKLNFSKNKNDFENYLNNCNVLDEVYQNKINDETAFFVKGTSPNLIQRNNQNNLSSNINNNKTLIQAHNLKKSFSIEKYHKKYITSTNKSKSERKNKNSLLKKKSNKLNLDIDKRTKNYSFSPTFSTPINVNNNIFDFKKSNISFKGFSPFKNKNYQIFHKKRNSYTQRMLSKENKINNTKQRKNINKFLDIKHIKSQDSYNNNQKYSEEQKKEILNKDTLNILKKIFLILDTENKGFIDIINEESKKIPIQIMIIITPIFDNYENNKISLNDFIIRGTKLFETLSFKNKKILYDYYVKL